MRIFLTALFSMISYVAANVTVVSYAPIVEKAAPAVVNIYTTRVVERTGSLFPGLFGEMFGSHHRMKGIQRALGSGVIVRPNGTIITNAHVVRDAGSIMIVFEDGSEEEAELMVADDRLDLAALTIKAKKDQIYPYLKIAPLDDLHVGDGVLAVGNPRGLNHTVTAGIISALGRTEVKPNDFRNLIQADLSLAQGSSGGALITIDGKLAGINTAILADGIAAPMGFAIPAELISHILRAVDNGGKLIYPFDGISGQTITGNIQRAMNRAHRAGVLVKAVVADSPADKAGIKRGDVLTHINDIPMKTPASHQFFLIKQNPRSTLLYTYVRDGKVEKTRVSLTTSPDATEKPFTIESTPILRGATVEELSPALNFAQDRDIVTRGVAINKVTPHSQAHRLGFLENDLIVRVNNTPIKTLNDLKKQITEGIRDLHIQRGDNTIRLVVN